MKRIGEEDLIAYHLGELPWWKRKLLSRRLGADAELAAESEEIAATLRAFSVIPVVDPSEAVWERSWHRVRLSLGELDPAPGVQRRWMWVAVFASVVAVIAAVVAIPRLDTRSATATNRNNRSSPPNWSQRVEAELSKRTLFVQPYNNRPGPLTTVPVDTVADDPALSAHLDVAERVLTEVSHTDGPLQPETREQVHRLLLENAVYRQSAEQHGDMETAAVIDDLGRVLTSLDAAEPLNVDEELQREGSDTFRLQMNLGGVLLDLRILHHGDPSNKNQ